MGVCYPGDSDFRSHLYCYLLLLLLWLFLPLGNTIGGRKGQFTRCFCEVKQINPYVLCVLEVRNTFDLNFFTNHSIFRSACLILIWIRTSKKWPFSFKGNATSEKRSLDIHILWSIFVFCFTYCMLYEYRVITLYPQQFFFLIRYLIRYAFFSSLALNNPVRPIRITGVVYGTKRHNVVVDKSVLWYTTEHAVQRRNSWTSI